MASIENSNVSERSQAYNCRKQKIKVSQIMLILYKSKNCVISGLFVVKLENLAREREMVVQLIRVFGQWQETMS